MAFTLNNTWESNGKRGKTDWWKWTAFIQAWDEDSLDDIEYVEYHLHPTFPNPVRRVRNKMQVPNEEGGFPLESSGWGVFDFTAKVVFKDKSRSPEMLKHFLKLG